MSCHTACDILYCTSKHHKQSVPLHTHLSNRCLSFLSTPYSIAPTKMTPCKFFAQGFCRNGDSCDFIHERNTCTQNHFEPVNPAAATHFNGRAKSTRICTFFMQGLCDKSDKCWYVHPPAIVPPQQVHPDAIYLDPHLGQQDESSPQAPSDSRARVLYKFLSLPGGCQNGSCLYLYAVDGHEVEKSSSQGFGLNEDEASSYFSDLCRSQY